MPELGVDVGNAERGSYLEPSRRVPIVAETDVLVVGGGPASVGAAVAAKREGARTLLAERYPYLGGMASGGMVLVIDDMMDGSHQTVLGLGQEYVERLERMGASSRSPTRSRSTPTDGSACRMTWCARPASICVSTAGSANRSSMATASPARSSRRLPGGRRSARA